MSRQPRTIVPEVPVHIVQRGNNRTQIFLSDEDFALGLLILQQCSKKFECAVHAYVLMGNHMHLLVTPGSRTGPARMMQSIGLRYVRYFNKQYERTGTLWEGRFRSSIVQNSQYFLKCSRYIELNPVRAGLATNPSEYAWSSFRRNALGLGDSIVTTHPLFQSLGRDSSERCTAYRALFEGTFAADVCDSIRRSTNAGAPMGDSDRTSPPATLTPLRRPRL